MKADATHAHGHTHTHPGHLRWLLEAKETGAMMLFISVMLLITGFGGVAEYTNLGQDWTGNADTFPPVALLLANLVLIVVALFNVFTGLTWILRGRAGRCLSLVNLVVTFFVLFEYTVVVASLAFFGAHYPKNPAQPYINAAFRPTSKQVDAVTAIATLCYTVYAASILSALVFFALKAFLLHSAKGTTVFRRVFYSATEFFYGFLTFAAGVLQLALGAWADDTYVGLLGDRLPAPLIAQAFVVYYPAIAITMGVLLMVHGLVIMARVFMPNTTLLKTGTAFDMWSAFVFIAAAALQVLTQISVGPKELAAASRTIYVVLALAVMPVYLDNKARTTGTTIADDHYVVTPPAQSGVGHKTAGNTFDSDRHTAPEAAV